MIDVDVIKQARQADLPTYLTRKGEHLKKDGAGYCLAEHGSLKIKGNMYHWFSRGTSGNALDFVREYYGLDFKAAVEELTGVSAPIEIKPIAYKPQLAELPRRADSEKRVIAYLVKKRGLDYGLVTDMIKRGFIYQDIRGNCVFVIKDFVSRKQIGYELTGTTDKRFKRISAHRGFGFNIRTSASVENIFLFESAIDLLSYYQLHRPSGMLVSMGGVNMSVADNLAGIFPEAQAEPAPRFVCCTDNDSAGDDFYEKLRGRYGDKVTRHAPQDAMDWNDYLNGRLRQD